MRRTLERLLIILAVAALAFGAGVDAAGMEAQIPKEYIAFCEEIGMKYHVSPEVLEAIIEHESRGIPTVGNDVGCYGLMGISAYWNAGRMERLGVKDLHDPYGNILVGADLLVELFEEKEDPYEVLRYYGGYPEGDYAFSEEILQRAWQLEVIHGKQDYLAKG